MVRFTDVEYALVSCSAEQAGYPVAVYVRKQAITEKLHVHYNIVADIAELRDFARQLSHIGNNLNQIAAFFNSGGIQSRAILEEINRCMTDLRAMRKEIAGLAGDYRGNLKTSSSRVLAIFERGFGHMDFLLHRICLSSDLATEWCSPHQT